MGREAMSARELDRIGVMARVGSGELKVVDAASLLGVSYRQAKRLGRRYREQGAVGLKHGNAGRRSHNAIEQEKRAEALRLVGEHYGGEVGERFGPLWPPSIWSASMAARCMRRRCGAGCWERACGVRRGSASPIARSGRPRRISESWCNWMEVITVGWKSAGPRAV